MTERELIAEARDALAQADDPWIARYTSVLLAGYSAALTGIEALRHLVTVSPDDLQAVTAYNTEVEAENSRLRKAFDEVLRSINTGQSVLSALCTFCGEHWPRLDGETFEDTKKHGQEHAMRCPEHPLRVEIERLKAELAAAREGRP